MERERLEDFVFGLAWCVIAGTSLVLVVPHAGVNVGAGLIFVTCILLIYLGIREMRIPALRIRYFAFRMTAWERTGITAALFTHFLIFVGLLVDIDVPFIEAIPLSIVAYTEHSYRKRLGLIPPKVEPKKVEEPAKPAVLPTVHRCPQCLAENPPDAVFCHSCGRGTKFPGALVTKPPKPKKSMKWLIVPAVICGLLLAIPFLIYAFSGGTIESPLYNIALHSRVQMDGPNATYSPGPGYVVVEGSVTNTGKVAGNAFVHLRIYTGYDYHEYDAPLGYVEPGSTVGVQWMQHFDQLNPGTFQVWYNQLG